MGAHLNVHLDPHGLVRLGKVGGVVPRHHAPHRVAWVEEVAAEVVEHGVAAREHAVELPLEPYNRIEILRTISQIVALTSYTTNKLGMN